MSESAVDVEVPPVEAPESSEAAPESSEAVDAAAPSKSNERAEEPLPDNWAEIDVEAELKLLKKVPRPDFKKQKALLTSMADRVEAIKLKIKSVEDQIVSVIASSKSKADPRSQLIEKIREKKTARAALIAQKKALHEQREEMDKALKQAQAEVKAMRGSIKFTTVEQIDEAIHEIEYKQITHSFSLTEQKQIMKDIQQLKASRKIIEKFSQANSKMNLDGSSLKELVAKIHTLNDEIDAVSDEVNTLEDELDAMSQNRSNDKFQEFRAEKNKLYDERSKIYDEKRQANESFTKLVTEFDEYMKKYRRLETIHYKQQHKEYEAQEKRRQQEEAEAKKQENPHQAELVVCDRLIAYLNTLLPARAIAQPVKEEPVEARAPASSGRVIAPPKGTVELSHEEEFYFVGSGGKKGGKKGKGGGGGNKASSGKTAKSAVQLSLDTFLDFQTLGLVPPKTKPEIPATLEQLQKRRVGGCLAASPPQEVFAAAKAPEAPTIAPSASEPALPEP